MLSIRNTVIRGRTIFLCGRFDSTDLRRIHNHLCSPELIHGRDTIFLPLLRMVAIHEHWAVDSAACPDDQQQDGRLSALELRPIHATVRLTGVALFHHLRSSNIAHYFYESFFPLFFVAAESQAQLDPGMAPAARPGGDLRWLQRLRGSNLTILLDSLVDFRKVDANSQWWSDDWADGRIEAEGGVPVSMANSFARGGIDYANAQNRDWVRSLYYCAIVHRVSSHHRALAHTRQFDAEVAYSADELWVGAQVSPHLDGPGRDADAIRRILDLLRARLHSCVGVTDVAKQTVLYTRADTRRRSWDATNVHNAERILQPALSRVGLPSARIFNKMPYDFASQVRLFANASLLIMPHGTAITNLIAMPARASVVEICPDNFSWADYFELKFAVAGYAKHYVPREDFIPRLPSSGDQRNPVALQVKPMDLLSSVSTEGVVGASEGRVAVGLVSGDASAQDMRSVIRWYTIVARSVHVKPMAVVG